MYGTHRNTTAQNMGYTSSGHRITPAPGTFRRTGKGQLAKPAKPATEKQTDLIRKLAAEATLLVTDTTTEALRDQASTLSQVADPAVLATLSLDAASGIIEATFDLIRKLRREATIAQFRETQVTDGIYYFNNEVVKVQKAVHGSGQLYAKRLVVTDGQGSWEYAPGLVRQLRPEHKMTLEQASEFGHLYGVCCVCGATLTNETSIDLGIGPVCRSRLS